MTPIDNYLPSWLHQKIKRSVDVAIKFDRYRDEFEYWVKKWPLGLLYFQHYYYKEVLLDYIETHGDWGEEQIKEGRIFNHGRLNK